MTHGSLFSGIGGFDLAAQWMGWENLFHCEWDEWNKKVLNYYWPNAKSYGDITKTDFTIWRGRIDIISGGFPCQPYSLAGKRLGKEDERHLWPEMLRAIREIQPTWVVGENVLGLVNWDGGLVFNEVQADLEAKGYEVQPYVLPACAVNAPHRRDRVWFVAFKNADKNGRRSEFREEKSSERQLGYFGAGDYERVQTDNGEVRPFADTDSRGLERSAKERRNCEYVERESCADGKKWDAPDTCNNGFFAAEIGQSDRERNDRNAPREKAVEQFAGCGSEAAFADTHDEGLERCASKRIQTNERRANGLQDAKFTRMGQQTDWSNFPTQSPICDGDDGLSSRLDGITFPKWRQQSIKAGGNAIVPQVALQIFKAIQEYDKMK